MSKELVYDMPKVVESPDRRSGDVVADEVISYINNFIRQQEAPTPIAAAKALHEVLVEIGQRSEADEIFYNFDGQYKVKFEENDRPQVAVFWAPWMGGVSWRIEDAV